MENILNKTKIKDYYFSSIFNMKHDLWSQPNSILYNNLRDDLLNLQIALKTNANGEYIY
jgi:hypothetical protein